MTHSSLLAHYRQRRATQESLLTDVLRTSGALTVLLVIIAVLWVGMHFLEP